MTTVSPAADVLRQASRFAAALVAPDGPGPQLHPAVRFMTLGRALDGREAVAAELRSPAYGRLAWQEPLVLDEAVRLTGLPSAGSQDRGLVLTLGFQDGMVALVQRQAEAAPDLPASPLILPATLREAIGRALVERHPVLMAYTDPEGQPVLSFRGSVQAFGDDRLALWVRNADGRFVRSLAVNPRVAFMYRNEDTRATWQLQGRARVSASEDDRRRIFDAAPEAERHHDFARLGVAVVVDLDRVEGYAGLGPAGPVGALRMQRQA